MWIWLSTSISRIFFGILDDFLKELSYGSWGFRTCLNWGLWKVMEVRVMEGLDNPYLPLKKKRKGYRVLTLYNAPRSGIFNIWFGGLLVPSVTTPRRNSFPQKLFIAFLTRQFKQVLKVHLFYCHHYPFLTEGCK